MTTKTLSSEDLFGLVSRVFGSAVGQSWSAGLDREKAVVQAFLIPTTVERSIERAPLHQRHAVRAFVDSHPLALDQLAELIEIVSDEVPADRLRVGEVRLSTNTDGDDILALYLRMKLTADEFNIAKRRIRQAYREAFPDGCQLVIPMLLRSGE